MSVASPCPVPADRLSRDRCLSDDDGVHHGALENHVDQRADGSAPRRRLRRTFSADVLNVLVNHPSIRASVGNPTLTDPIDLGPVAADARNVCLLSDHGAFVGCWIEPGLYEVHSLFLPDGRGDEAKGAATEGLHRMFVETDAWRLVTKVPEGAVAASALARACGFTRDHALSTHPLLQQPLTVYSLGIEHWIDRSERCRHAGVAFHEVLEQAKHQTGSTATVHHDEEAHDRYAGFAMLAGLAANLHKGEALYNRWARVAGYVPMQVCSVVPPVVDIGDAILGVEEGRMEVMLCR